MSIPRFVEVFMSNGERIPPNITVDNVLSALENEFDLQFFSQTQGEDEGVCASSNQADALYWSFSYLSHTELDVTDVILTVRKLKMSLRIPPTLPPPAVEGQEHSDLTIVRIGMASEGTAIPSTLSSDDVVNFIQGAYDVSLKPVLCEPGALIWDYVVEMGNVEDIEENFKFKKHSFALKQIIRGNSINSLPEPPNKQPKLLKLSMENSAQQVFPDNLTPSDIVKYFATTYDIDINPFQCDASSSVWSFTISDDSEIDSNYTIKKHKIKRISDDYDEPILPPAPPKVLRIPSHSRSSNEHKEVPTNANIQFSVHINDQKPLFDSKASYEEREVHEILHTFKCAQDCMPECCERSLIMLHCYFNLYNKNCQNPLEKEDVESLFIKVLTQLKDEDEITIGVEDSLLDMYQQYCQNCFNSESITDKLWEILRNIQPMNMEMMLSYIVNMEKAANLIAGKDIILLLGSTGTGKSTTIHFLAGSKLVATEVDGLDHISPLYPAAEVASVISSPFNRSETKIINAVNIVYERHYIILCDSPGFGDTSGAEFDLANGIGLARAMRGCNSVKPLVLVSNASIGDRCEGISKLSDTLVKFITSAESNLSAFSYVFTKFDKNRVHKIAPLIIDKLRNLTNDEKSKPAFVAMIQDIINKTKDGAKILNPIQDPRSYILDDLLSSPAITNPRDVFRDFASPSSAAVLKNQLWKHRHSITISLQRFNVGLLSYKLSQLKTLNDNTNLQECQQVYCDCLNDFFLYIRKLLDTVFNLIEKAKSDQIVADDCEFDGICDIIQKLYVLELIRKRHFCENTILDDISLVDSCAALLKTFLSSLSALVVESLGQIEPKIQVESIHFVDKAATAMNKLVKISQLVNDRFQRLNGMPEEQVFEAIDEIYIAAVNAISQKFASAKQLFSAGLLKYSFSCCLHALHTMKILADRFNELVVFNDVDSAKIYKQHVDEFQEKVINILYDFSRNLHERKLTLETIPNSEASFNSIRNLLTEENVRDHLDYDNVQRMVDKCLLDCANFVESTGDLLKEMEGDGALYQSLRSNLDLIDLLRNDSHGLIALHTAEVYLKLTSQITTLIENYKSTAYELINVLIAGKQAGEDVLKYCIVDLFTASCYLYEHPSHTYHQEYEFIISKIVDYLLQVLSQVMNQDADFSSINLVKSFVHQFYCVEIFVNACSELSSMDNRSADLNFGNWDSLCTVAKDSLYAQVPIQIAEQIRLRFKEKVSTVVANIRLYFQDLNANELKSYYETSISKVICSYFDYLEVVNKFNCFEKLSTIENTIQVIIGEFFADINRKMSTILKYITEYNKNADLEVDNHILELRICLGFLASFEQLNEVEYYNLAYRELFVTPASSMLLQWCGENSYLRKQYEEFSCQFDEERKFIGNVDNLYPLWNLCKLLKSVDDFMPAEMKFQTISFQFDLSARNFSNNIITDIKCGNFVKVAEDLAKYDPTIPEMKVQRDNIISELENSIIQRSEGYKQRVSQIAFDLNSDKFIKAFWDELSIECDNVKALRPFLSESLLGSFEDSLLCVVNSIYEKAIAFLSSMEANLTQLKFLEAEQSYHAAFQISQLEVLLDNTLLDNLKKSLEGKRKTIDDQITAAIDLYIKFEFELLTRHPPSILFDKFKAAQSINNNVSAKYSEACNRLDQLLYHKLAEKLNRIKELDNYVAMDDTGTKINLEETFDSADAADSMTIEEGEELINRIESSAPFLPPELYGKFVEHIQSCKTLIEEAKRVVQRDLEEDSNANNIQKSIRRLYKYYQRNDLTSMEKVRNIINAHFQKADARFKGDIEKNDMLTVFKNLPKIWEDWMYYIYFLKEVGAKCRHSRHVQFFKDKFCDEISQKLVQLIVSKIQEAIVSIEKVEKGNSNSLKNSKASFVCLLGFLDLKDLLIAENYPSTLFQSLVKLDNQLEVKSLHAIEHLVNCFNEWSNRINDFLYKISLEVDPAKEKDGVKIIDFSIFDEIEISFEAIQANNELLLLIDEFCQSEYCKRYGKQIVQAKTTFLDGSQISKLLCKHLLERKKVILDSFLNNVKTKTKNSLDRDDFYKTINESYKIIVASKRLTPFVDGNVCNIANIEIECRDHIKSEMELIVSHASNQMRVMSSSSGAITSSDASMYNEFNIANDNLRSIADCFEEKSIVQIAKSKCEGVEYEFFQSKLTTLKDSAWLNEQDWKNYLQYIESICVKLIEMKKMALEIPQYKDKIEGAINQLLLKYKQRPDGAMFIGQLGLFLNASDNPVAHMIISEHEAFQGYALSLRNEKTLKYTIDNVLADITGDNIDKGALKNHFDLFDKEYWDLVERGLTLNAQDGANYLNNLVVQSREIADGDRDAYSVKVRSLMARLFAFWTLSNSNHYKEASGNSSTNISTRNNYLLQPHAAQVISIFRLFGMDIPANHSTGILSSIASNVGSMLSSSMSSASKSSSHQKNAPLVKLDNHFVQISTGEGKSVTLAVTAGVLALLGYHVDCACYSEYLSRRDHEAFLPLFTSFNLNDSISYGTFNRLCENFLNCSGDLRAMVSAMVTNNQQEVNRLVKPPNKERILLIDEVDVFFNKDFYGNMYKPFTRVIKPEINALVEYIWANRKTPGNLAHRSLLQTVQYKACAAQFNGWEFIVEESVKRMVMDIRTYETHEYHVDKQGNRIGYVEHDKISYNKINGYKTMWAYFKQVEGGHFPKATLQNNIYLIIDCGCFSYGEVPKLYASIIGVTGTLKTLSVPELDLLKNVYHVNKYTFTPSVYGNNQLSFRQDNTEDFKIESPPTFYKEIVNEITRRLVGSVVDRAVLVFFESTKKVNEFMSSPEMAQLRGQVRVMREGMSPAEREATIRNAVSSKSITLLSREFGRGTDFICYDDKLNASGGVHVIQTFFSEELSEETQIKGRTARQGNRGSFGFILLGNELEKFGITTAIVNSIKNSGKLYTTVDEYRTRYFMKKYPETMKYVKEISDDHNQSRQFYDNLISSNIQKVKAFLLERNKMPMVAGGAVSSRTICLMDATGSMSGTLDKAKRTVKNMFDRAYKILLDNNISNGFEFQFAVYRNYSSKSLILQYSTWECEPKNIYAFMDSISTSGGQGNEAIEIGLWHVNDEMKNGDVTQVILIGDMPPNTKSDVTSNRDGAGSSYWASTQYAAPTYYQDELSKICQRNVPVHCFYVDDSAAEAFREIANKSKGKTGSLDIDSDRGAEMLTALVTERILENVGGDAMGKVLVDAYRAQFGNFGFVE